MMDGARREAYDAVRRTDHQPFASGCYAPFVSLYLDVQGRILACGANRSTLLGLVGRDPLVDAWRGVAADSLRSALVDYDFGHGCQACETEIAGGNPTGPLAAGFDHFAASAPGDQLWPRRMEFALSNACSLQCVMCNGYYSSAIRSRREGLPPLPARYGAAFLEELRPFLPHLRQARFLGGEPFLTEENFRIWDLMIDEGLSIDCNVTTNGMQFGPRVRRVLERLPFSIGVSIDGVRAGTVESIRVGASFDRIMENLASFRVYTAERGTSLSLTYCLMVPNWKEFADYLLLAEDLGCQVHVNTVNQPPRYSLYRLPLEELTAVVHSMEKQTESLLPRLVVNDQVWLGQLRRLRDCVEERSDAELHGREEAYAADLVARLTAAPNSIHLFEAHVAPLVAGPTWEVRCDPADKVVETDGYFGLSPQDAVGEDYVAMSARLLSTLGPRFDILAERTANGLVARVVRFRDDHASETVIATVMQGERDAEGRWMGVAYRGAVIDLAGPPWATPVKLGTRR